MELLLGNELTAVTRLILDVAIQPRWYLILSVLRDRNERQGDLSAIVR
jgi:hypothetical protein